MPEKKDVKRNKLLKLNLVFLVESEDQENKNAAFSSSSHRFGFAQQLRIVYNLYTAGSSAHQLARGPSGFYLLFSSSPDQKEQVVNTSQCVMRDVYK